LGFLLQYMTPDEVAKEWAASEEQVRSIRAAGGK
jgi:hypothetical protein